MFNWRVTKSPCHRLVRRHEQRRFALGIRRVGRSLGGQQDPQHVAMAVEGGDLTRRRAWRQIQGIQGVGRYDESDNINISGYEFMEISLWKTRI